VRLAISASRINSLDANFPVPTSRRDVNSRSAIFSLEGLSAITKRISEFAQGANAVAAGVPPASSSNSQPTRLPLQTVAIFCLYELVNHATFHFVTRFDLRHEDCIEGMARLADESIDLVVTSPPYNLGIRYGKFSDSQDRESYLRWCTKWAEQVRRILKPTGSFFLNIGAAPSNPMLPHEIVIELCDVFVLQNTIHWIKSIAIEDREGEVRSYGHFKPISSKRFVNDCHEYVFHFTK